MASQQGANGGIWGANGLPTVRQQFANRSPSVLQQFSNSSPTVLQQVANGCPTVGLGFTQFSGKNRVRPDFLCDNRNI